MFYNSASFFFRFVLTFINCVGLSITFFIVQQYLGRVLSVGVSVGEWSMIRGWVSRSVRTSVNALFALIGT